MSHSVSCRIALSTIVALGLSSGAFAANAATMGISGVQVQSIPPKNPTKNQGGCDPIECSTQFTTQV